MDPNKDISSFISTDSQNLYKLLHSSPRGLSASTVEKRLREFGHNTLNRESRRHIIVEFLLTLKNPLILILLCVVAISFFLGQTVDAVIVLLMVVLSAVLNFTQEHRANEIAKKLQRRVAHTTMVIREGKEEEIPARDVVRGDIIRLNAGDLVPADARIILAKDLFINQSALTGESFPAEKTAESIKNPPKELTAMSNIAFAGTSVITGSATVIVLRTGMDTEFGHVAERLNEAKEENEFTRGIGTFSILILRIILIFVLFVFLANVFIKGDLLQAITFSIAIAVGLTPEFLPMIMTVTMSRGSQNMAKKGVIVKRLTAIPTFGSMEILCTDKTGTLTQDRITLVKYVNGLGRESEDVFQSVYVNSSYQTGITNPMDEAVRQYKHLDIARYKKIDEIPYDFERKRMSVVVEVNRRHLLITKGAPEEILKTCTYLRREQKDIHKTPLLQKKLHQQYEALSSEGFRVLAVAEKYIPAKKKAYTKRDEEDLVFIGFAAFLDPPKAGVKEAIDELERMGVEVKVITGDNELVTKKICDISGIGIRGIVLGSETHHLTNEQLYHRARKATIFARFSPAQKERVIDVLRHHGNIVGYLGDGINDAPSLKAADVGISVSNGVDVAKESSDIILTHKSLHQLRDGVIEGRKTFGNTLKYILMGLSSNFGNMFSVSGAVLLLPFLPMLPIQILLNNFLYDIGQITIPSDTVDEEFIEKPKRWDMGYIRNFMLIFGPISSVFDYLSFFILFLFFKNQPGSFQTGWFMESLATQTLVIHVIRTRRLPFIQSTGSGYLLFSTFAVVTAAWIMPFTPLASYFGFSPLPLSSLLILAEIVILYLVVAEIGKRYFYRKFYPV